MSMSLIALPPMKNMLDLAWIMDDLDNVDEIDDSRV